tara:strand:+ start:2341 stop:2526 length:186 start_codon:yes stop_codon:yes gene_type:complete
MFYYIKYYYKSLKEYYFPKKKREQPESKVISKPELSQKQKQQLSKHPVVDIKKYGSFIQDE